MMNSNSSLAKACGTLIARRLVIAVLCACSLSAVSTVSAQGAQRSRSVIIAVADSFPAARGYAVIMRDADAAATDVVILPSTGATPDALAGALIVLQKLRAQGAPAHKQIVTLTGLHPRSIPPRIAAWLANVMQRASQQPATRIGNIGRGKWIELADAVLGA